MKKFIKILAILPLFLALSFISGDQPKAAAASIDTGKLLEIISSDEATATIREIVKVGAEIKKGNTDELKTAVLKKSLERAGLPGQTSKIVLDSIKDIRSNPQGISKILAKNAEDLLKAQLKAYVNERLSPHQEKLLILATLLNLQNE